MNFQSIRRRAITIDASGAVMFAIALLWGLLDDDSEPVHWVVFDSAFLAWTSLSLLLGILATTWEEMALKQAIDSMLGCTAATVSLVACTVALFGSDGWDRVFAVLGVAVSVFVFVICWRSLRRRAVAQRDVVTGGQR